MLRENSALTARKKKKRMKAWEREKKKTQLITDVIKSMHNLKALAKLFLLHGSCDLGDTHTDPFGLFYQPLLEAGEWLGGGSQCLLK